MWVRFSIGKETNKRKEKIDRNTEHGVWGRAITIS